MSKFGCIVADPLWAFDNDVTRGAAENHYPTLTARQIARIPVDEWASDNAHLYLWVPSSMLEDGLRVMRSWDFKYKTKIVWVKTTQNGALAIGLGNWFRNADELCLFGTRGRAPARAKDLPTIFWGPRQEHSVKPERLQEMAEKMSPGPFLELFARRQRPGWTCLGNELGTELSKPCVLPTPQAVEPAEVAGSA